MAKTHTEALEFVKDLLKTLGFVYDTIELVTDEESSLTTISIQSKDSRFLIGKDGETLNAMSTLLHRFLERSLKDGEAPLPITLDVNDFQKKHIENIKTKAHMMAERAKFFKSSIELDPMNGYERRIIHTFLEKDKNILTDSTGEGKNRRIVITYTEDKTATM